jgi:hypothetical protein
MDLSHNVGVCHGSAPIPAIFYHGNTTPLDFGAGSAINQNTVAFVYALHERIVWVHDECSFICRDTILVYFSLLSQLRPYYKEFEVNMKALVYIATSMGVGLIRTRVEIIR